jgi:hypothetical protein
VINKVAIAQLNSFGYGGLGAGSRARGPVIEAAHPSSFLLPTTYRSRVTAALDFSPRIHPVTWENQASDDAFYQNTDFHVSRR